MVYDKIVSREEDGPDPLVPEPVPGTAQVKRRRVMRKGNKRTLIPRLNLARGKRAGRG
jgi:hypothetical protein